MRKILLLAALLFPCSALAQLPYLPLVQSNFSAANVNSNTCIFNQNATIGNYVFLSLDWQFSNNTPSVSDSQGNTYTQQEFNTANNVKLAVYSTTATANNTITITASVAGSARFDMTCYEFTPVFTLTQDVKAIATFSGTPSTASASVTTGFNNDLVLCTVGGDSDAGLNFSAAPFVMIGLANGSGANGAEFNVAGVAGSTSCTFNNRASATGVISIIAFKTTSSITIQSPSVLPDGALSTAYQYTLLSTGGTGALTWSITSGSLQSGLSLNASSGVISGTPSGSSNNNITFQVTDGTHTTTKAVTLKVTTAFNTPTVVQTKGAAASVTSLAFTSNVTNGDLIIVAGGSGSSVTGLHAEVMYCTDSLGTPFKLLSNFDYQSVVSNQSRSIAFYGGIAPSGGADTVQCGAPAGVTAIYELTNVQLFGNENVGAGLRGTSSSPITSNSLTTIVPNELLFATAATYTSSGSVSISSPFTGATGNTGWFSSSGSNSATTVTGYTAGWTFSGNTDTGWGIAGILGIRPGSNGVIANAVRHKGQVI